MRGVSTARVGFNGVDDINRSQASSAYLHKEENEQNRLTSDGVDEESRYLLLGFVVYFDFLRAFREEQIMIADSFYIWKQDGRTKNDEEEFAKRKSGDT